MKCPKRKLADLSLYMRRGISPIYVDAAGVTVLNQKCIRAQRIDFDRARLTSPLTRIQKEKILQPGDVIINSTGTGTVGRTARFLGYEVPVTADSHLTIVRPNQAEIEPTYFGYFLGWREPIIERMAKGATNQVELSIVSLGEIEIALPPRSVQVVIAKILAAYDDRIENNRRRVALLEEAARHLYREWFVRLRFPGHEHTRITNAIPEGWERKPVEALTAFLRRGITPNYDEEAEGLVINQKCIRGGRIDLTLARHQTREFKSEWQVQQGDVLVNSTGEGTLGRVAQVLAPIDECTVDTHVTILRPAPGLGSHYFGHALMEWEPRFSKMGRGATNQTELSPGQIGAVQILVPPTPLVRLFEDFAVPCFRQVWVLTEQYHKLRSARNLLLPRLMSGEIPV